MATHKICEIYNCGKKYFCNGLCSAHYWRWKKYGNALGGGTANGEPIRYFNEVVIAYDGNECLIWPYARTSAGYGHMSIDGRHKLISRLVCENISGAPPSDIHEAAHKCGNGNLGCVSPKHIAWKTPKENAIDRIGHGTQQRVFSEAKIKEIIALRGAMTQTNIAKVYGVHQATISRIHLGKAYKEIA